MEFITLFCIVFITFIMKVKNQDSFSAVTSFKGLTSLYLRMKIRDPHLTPNTTVDATTKQRICWSVTKSGYFSLQNEEYPVLMDKIYPDLDSYRENENKDFKSNTFIDNVLQDYEGTAFTYRTRLVQFTTDYGNLKEFAFACVSKDRIDGHPNIYYISDPYNINLALDIPTNDQIRARFICWVTGFSCRLIALAEQPATALSSPYNFVLLRAFENIYRRMRKFYKISRAASDDPLCGLTKSEKLRICASIMTASFASTISGAKFLEFNPDQDRFSGECQLKEVIFRSKVTKVEEKDESYVEWMLPCRTQPRDSKVPFVYFVSRAYHSHHAIVYLYEFLSGGWFIENILTNISVLVEEENDTIHEGSAPPNLIDLLENFSNPYLDS